MFCHFSIFQYTGASKNESGPGLSRPLRGPVLVPSCFTVSKPRYNLQSSSRSLQSSVESIIFRFSFLFQAYDLDNLFRIILAECSVHYIFMWILSFSSIRSEFCNFQAKPDAQNMRAHTEEWCFVG
jgi:hypothetical protein